MTATLADTPTPQPGPPPPPPPAPLAIFKSCPRPFGRSDIAITAASPETPRFDALLRARLIRRQPSVVVDMTAPFAVESGAPPELSAWLTQVKATQGVVTMRQYCEQSRGFMSFLNKMFTGTRTSRYAAADGYDAVLHIDGVDQRVTQVEFRLRGKP
jgi:hypothetical protein